MRPRKLDQFVLLLCASLVGLTVISLSLNRNDKNGHEVRKIYIAPCPECTPPPSPTPKPLPQGMKCTDDDQRKDWTKCTVDRYMKDKNPQFTFSFPSSWQFASADIYREADFDASYLLNVGKPVSFEEKNGHSISIHRADMGVAECLYGDQAKDEKMFSSRYLDYKEFVVDGVRLRRGMFKERSFEVFEVCQYYPEENKFLTLTKFGSVSYNFGGDYDQTEIELLDQVLKTFDSFY